ncbi:MAG: hypothetical protein RIM84_08645 [Alphaproteobacteria bacterium]
MYENRTFEPYVGAYSSAMDRNRLSVYDVHAAIAAGRRERAKVFTAMANRAGSAIKSWFAGRTGQVAAR